MVPEPQNPVRRRPAPRTTTITPSHDNPTDQDWADWLHDHAYDDEHTVELAYRHGLINEAERNFGILSALVREHGTTGELLVGMVAESLTEGEALAVLARRDRRRDDTKIVSSYQRRAA